MAPRIWESVQMEVSRLHERWDNAEGKLEELLQIGRKLMSFKDDLDGLLGDMGTFLDDLDTVLPALVQQSAGQVDGVTDAQINSLRARLAPLRQGFDALVVPAAQSAPDPTSGSGDSGTGTAPAGDGTGASDGAVTPTGTTDPAGVTDGGTPASA